MEKQNITLSIPKDILQQVKILAAKRDTSVTRMLTEALEALIREESGYEAARRSHTRRLQESASLCTYGETNWDRDSLHER